MHNGKAYENEVRKIFMYVEKMKTTKEEIMSTQLAQKTLVSEPVDEVQNREVTEVESLKLELAKHGVMMSNDALKRGIVLPNREQRFTEKRGNPEYPACLHNLLKNPFEKKKQKKKKKGADSPLRKRRGGKKSPTKADAKGSQDSIPTEQEEMDDGPD